MKFLQFLTTDSDPKTRSPARPHEFDIENSLRDVIDHHVELDLEFHPMLRSRKTVLLLLLERRRRVSQDLTNQVDVEVVKFIDGYDAIAFLNATRSVCDRVVNNFCHNKSAARLRRHRQTQSGAVSAIENDLNSFRACH